MIIRGHVLHRPAKQGKDVVVDVTVGLSATVTTSVLPWYCVMDKTKKHS